MLMNIPSRTEDLALFTRHLAGGMQARVPLPEILRAYAQEAESRAMGRSALALAEEAAAGRPLSAAMGEQPKIFPPAYRRLIELGENGHALGPLTLRLAETLEIGLRTYEYFRRAAIYPLFVLCLLGADVLFVLVMITPKFNAIFSELGGDMPGLFHNASHFANLLLWVFAALLAIPITFLLASLMRLRLPGFGYGHRALQLPLVGPVLRKAETARFSGDLALLLENGVPMAEALELLAQSASNSYVRDAIGEFQHRYAAGERLGGLVAKQPLFPPSMATLITSGEEQGTLPATLRGLGDFYTERTAQGLALLREVFEPMMLLLVGLLVALIVISFYGPLFEIPRLIR